MKTEITNKKYVVRAAMTTYLTTTIEASTETEAYEIAQTLDGGIFDIMENESDWEIQSAEEQEN